MEEPARAVSYESAAKNLISSIAALIVEMETKLDVCLPPILDASDGIEDSPDNGQLINSLGELESNVRTLLNRISI